MSSILVYDFVIVIMIFVRIISAFAAAPVFGHKALPMIPKIFISLIIAYIIFSTGKFSEVNIQYSLWFLVFMGLKEAAAGFIIGFAINLIFYAFSFAGALIGVDIGLTMAEIFNPMEETQNNVIGEFVYTTAILLFLLIDGHHYLIRGLLYSFSSVGIGEIKLSDKLFNEIFRMSGQVFIIAIKIASPIMISFFLLHIAEGIISRVVPQMQVFFVTQPLKIGIGFLLLFSMAPIYIYVIKYLLRGYEDELFQLIKTMGR